MTIVQKLKVAEDLKKFIEENKKEVSFEAEDMNEKINNAEDNAVILIEYDSENPKRFLTVEVVGEYFGV